MKSWKLGLWLVLALVLPVVAQIGDPVPWGAKDSVYGLRSRLVDNPNFNFFPSPEDWRDVNMYQIFTDRFASSGETLSYIQQQDWYVGNRSYPLNRNYHHGGDWKGLLQNLDYLEGLGVTAVWMSGVQMNWQGLDKRFTPYHYYHPTDFFKVDPAQGTFQDLKNVIDAMHARGMYVILDVVINHTADLSGLWGNNREDNRWYWPNGNGTHGWWDQNRKHAPPFDDLQFFHNHGRIRNWDSFPEYLLGAFPGTDDLKTSRQDVRQYLDLAFKNLIDATDCDGFRVDAIKHVEEDWIMQWADDMRKHAASRGKNDFIIFGEYFTYDNETLARYARQQNYSFNSALFFPMSQTFKSVFVDGAGTGQLTQQLNNKTRYGEAENRLVTFIDNHDVNRIGLQAGGNVGHIEKIMPPALTFLYTATPVPCLFYGTEHAFQQGGHWNGQNAGTDFDDADWQRETMFNKGFQPGPAQGNKLAQTNAPLYQHIARLNRARAENISLRRGSFQERWQSGSRGPYAFSRVYDQQEALVAFNTADGSQNINPQVGKDNGTEFVNVLNPAEKVTVSGGRISFSLSPQETKIFVAGLATPEVWARGTHSFPLAGDVTSDTPVYINTEAGPVDVVTNVVLGYSLAGGVAGSWTSVNMTVNTEWSSNGGAWYNAVLPAQPAGTVIQYYIAVEGEEASAAFDNNDNQNYTITVAQGLSNDLWIRNTKNWPLDGNVTEATDLYVDTEVGPLSSVESVDVFYSLDSGDTWTHVPMTVNAAWGSQGGSWYNVNLGKFAAGARIWYYIEASDGEEEVVSNNGGTFFRVSVRGAPLAITDPASDLAVPFATSNITVSGSSDGVAGELTWSNALTGATGTLAAGASWSIADVELAVGENVIVVSGALEGSGTGTTVVAADNVGNYSSGWLNGSNEGDGFGAWVLSAEGQAGHFPGANGFGLWSHEGGNFAAAVRPFSAPLTEGQSFSVRMQNGWIWEEGGSVGIALRGDEDEKFLVYFNGGADNYAGTHATDIPWTDQGIDVVFTLTGPNAYSVTMTPVGGSTRTYTGTFTGTINNFRAWSANNGTGDEFNSNRDFFFNNLEITAPGSQLNEVSAVITVVRAEADAQDSNEDGVPDWWYELYELDPEEPALGQQRSPSGYTFWAAYVMNLNPMDENLPPFEMTVVPQGPSFVAPGDGRRYMMQFTPSLHEPFVDIGESVNVGQHITINGEPSGFYRVRYLDVTTPGPTGVVESVTVSAVPGSQTFTNAAGLSVQLRVSGVNVASSQYSINNGSRVTYRHNDTITVGAASTNDQVTTLTLYGETQNGTQVTQTYGYTFRDTSTAPALTSVAGTHHWVSEDNQVFINSAGYPEGSSTAAYIIYCVNGPCEGNWPLIEMSRIPDWVNGDWWNKDLGILEDGDVVQFAIMMTDGVNEVWDNNNNQNYTVAIGGGLPPIEPGGMMPYSTNPTFGKRGTMTINGNPAGWTDEHLIAIDMANDDPRSLGGNWTMHEAPLDLTHLWAAWDDNNLYLAWQFVDVTDVIDPSNAGGAGSGKISNNDGILQWIVIDTIAGQGATSDMWGKFNSWTGANKPNYQIYLAGSLWQGYISRAVDGVFPVDDGGVNYNTVAAAGITVAKGNTFGGSALWGVGDADDRFGGATRNFLTEGHDTSRDSFYEMSIPLSYLGITASQLDTTGIGGVMIGAGSASSMDSIPHDETTLNTPGVESWNSSLEWGDVDIFTAPFARIGGGQ